MTCPYCGTESPESTTVCPACGAALSAAQPAQASLEQPAQNGTPAPGQAFPAPEPDPYKGHSMGWYKFHIYFALFANAIVNGLSSLSYFTGTIFGAGRDDVYRAFPAVPIICVVMGFLMLGFAVLAIITRFSLAALEKKGPLLLYLVYGVEIVFSLLFALALYLVTGVSEVFDSSLISSVVLNLVFLIVNIVYFTKRKDIFVN